MNIKKLEDITQECVHSWPKSEKYSEFSKMTDILHWLEKNEEFLSFWKTLSINHSLANYEHILV